MEPQEKIEVEEMDVVPTASGTRTIKVNYDKDHNLHLVAKVIGVSSYLDIVIPRSEVARAYREAKEKDRIKAQAILGNAKEMN